MAQYKQFIGENQLAEETKHRLKLSCTSFVSSLTFFLICPMRMQINTISTSKYDRMKKHNANKVKKKMNKQSETC